MGVLGAEAKRIGLAALCALILAASLSTLVQAAPQAGQAKRAEGLVAIGASALTYAKSLVSAANATIAVSPGLRGVLNASLALTQQAEALIDEAKKRLQAGEEAEAVSYALQAMGKLREGLRLMAAVRGEAREAQEKAQGLLVAANRTLERIEQLEDKYRVDLSEARRLLEKIPGLIERGDVSEAARILAEANQLVAQVFSELKSRAEGRVAERVVAFVEKLSKVQDRLSKEVERVGLNASNFFEAAGLVDFAQLKETLAEVARGMEPRDVKRLIDELKEARKRLREVEVAISKITPRLEEAPPHVNIADLLDNLTSWSGRAVIVVGKMLQSPPRGLPGPRGAPPSGSWIVADGTGWIYVVSSEVFLGPRAALHEGATVKVLGVLTAKDEAAPYIEATVV
ncbi:MAG: hypothetical protein N3H31_06765, partial [Candidatus Nezhaarchaeota archaeon]|nr:hypothetical protein [Candidatus Nezhaarchaeota archaeon]